MLANVKQWAQVAVAAPVVLLVVGFGVGTLVAAPPYAVVYVDDVAKTVLAPQCADHYEQKAAGAAVLRRTTMGEADARHYELDYDCKETGAFSQDGPSLTGLLLSHIGLFPRKTYWWDQPFRTEDGVVYPGKSGPRVPVTAEADGTPTFCYQGLPGKSGPEKFDLTPQQLDICATFAQRHRQAEGVVETETPDQLIHRWSDENGLCSAPIRDRAGGPSRKPTQDEVSQCVVNYEIARAVADAKRRRQAK